MSIRLAIALLFLTSGALGVVDEVLWARLLGLHLGHAATAHATVVATFLLGLGLGYAWLGQQADRLARPLRRYAWLELGIGVWCLAFPHALSMGLALQEGAGLGASGMTGRILLAATLLLPPTIAMGGTLPALIRLLGTGPAAGGRALATLYGLNSLGAVLGGLLAGFYLLEAWGMASSMTFAGMGSIAVGGAALLLERATSALPTAATAAPATPPESAPAPVVATSEYDTTQASARRQAAVAGAIAALSGLAALLMQTLWFRVFGVVLGSSAYVFALVIAAIIAGITGGAIVARMLLRERPGHSGEVRASWLVVAALVAAALLLLVSPAHERLPWWLAHLRYAIQPETFEAWQLARLGLIAGVIMIPAVAMGVLLPLCGRLAMRTGRVAGAAAGVFAWNTVGSVLGAALGGTMLVPLVGLHGALLVAVVLLLLAGGIAFVALPDAPERMGRDESTETTAAPTSVTNRRRLLLGAWVFVAVWAALDPGPWDVRLLSAGAFRRKVRAVPTWAIWKARLLREDVVFSADGPDATVAVLERNGGRVLKVNGKPDASSRGDMLTQVASAWVPAVLAKRAERILVIGLGSGVTAGAASRLSKGVEVVEIAPAVVDAARHFGPWNRGVVDNPDVAMHVDDARAWLARTDQRWDIIISEPSNPWVAGNGALFTREFFQLARRHLTPGGVMAQWFHAYEMDDELLQLVLRTVADSFPHVSLWTLFPGDLLLIATESPQNQLPADAKARLARGMADLRGVDLHDLSGLLSLQALSPAQLRAHFADGGELHVDDKPLLELRAPRALFRGGRATVVKNADQRRGWPPAPGTLLSTQLPLALTDVRLTTLRGLVRLHVRFASAPASFRHELLVELARRETDVAGLRAVVFTYGREGPLADARLARDRLLKLAPTDPASLFAIALVTQRLGEDGRRHLRRCVALGDDRRGRCRRALRRTPPRP